MTGGHVDIKNAAVGQGASISLVIQRSLDKVESVSDKPELQQLLRDLCGQMTELTKRLPIAEQSKVAKDLPAFVAEVTSPSPRKPWYELSGKGLVEAAKAVADLASPITTVVSSIFQLLGKIAVK